MATILNVDGSSNVMDVTTTTWADATGAPERTGCTQVVLTADQVALLTAAQVTPNGGLMWDGTTFAALPVPAPPAIVDPLKPYRDALTTAATNDASLSTDTKTALTNLLAAMAPR